jgi:hypothetical protein
MGALAGIRWRMTWSRWRTRRTSNPILVAFKLLFVLGPVVLLSVVLFMTFKASFTSVNSVGEAEVVLGTLLALTTLGCFIGSSTTALQSLYLSTDMPFLMTLPVPLRVIYATKLTDAMAGSLPAGVVMLFVFLAFGYEQNGGGLYFLVAIICMLSLFLVATSCSVLLVAAVTRFVPPKRARFFLVIGSLAIVFIVWSVWAALIPRPGELAGGSVQSKAGVAGDIVAYSPAGWAADALYAAASGQFASTLIASLAFVAFAALCTLFAYRVFATSFAIGYAKVRGLAGARPKRPFANAAANVVSLLPQSTGALVVKEWLVMFRDLRRLSGAFWPLGMVAVYTVALGRGGNRGSDTELNFWLANASLALLPWGTSLGISIYAIGTEGKNFELVRMTPTPARRLLMAKAIASLVPILVATESATLIVTVLRGAQPSQILGMTGIVAWAAIGYVLIDTAAAALEPNFDAEHVQRSTSLGGRIAGFFAGAAFGVFSMTAIGRILLYSTEPPSSLAGALAWKVGPVAPFGWPLVVVATLFAIAVVAVSVSAAVANLNRLIREGT